MFLNSTHILAYSERSWYFHAAVNPWLMGVIFLLAGAMIVYLYIAQKSAASPGVVRLLTGIRILLLILLLVMLLQPAVRWVHRKTVPGNLWLVLDSTGSMSTKDPQSTPLERLRWADALELLPEASPPNRLDRSVAMLGCLRGELSRISAPATYAHEDSPKAKFITDIKTWNQKFETTLQEIVNQTKGQSSATVLADRLKEAGKIFAESTMKADGAQDLPGAISAIAWSKMEGTLDVVRQLLSPMADKLDEDYLKTYSNNVAVKSAMEKVAGRSRSDLAKEMLSGKFRKPDQSLIEALKKDRVRIVTIADKSQTAATVDGSDIPAAINRAMVVNGQSTNLAAGLQAVMDSSTGESSNVLMISDGRQNVDGDVTGLARQLGSQGSRVFALGFGSNELSVDAAVETVDAPDWVYKDDNIRAAARVRLDGLPGKEVTVEFWRDQVKVDTKKITPAKSRETQVVTFEDKHPDLGVHDFQILIPELPREENKDNNKQSFRVSVKKDQLKILVIEEQARWEYRHIVSYLSRDPRVKLQSVLLQPTRIENVTVQASVKASPINPKMEAQILPETKEEWLAFDVVILGDVAPKDFTAEMQKNLASAIKDGGKTLIVLAGPRNMPSSFGKAPLAESLPVTMDGDWSVDLLLDHNKAGFRPTITPDGANSVLSQFRTTAEDNAVIWAASPVWYWHSEQTRAKPSANVLWSIASPNETLGLDMHRRRALLATQSFGIGKVMYLSSDQTWRWRQVNGENLQDKFWGQVVRWAVGNDLPAGGAFARFGSDRPRYSQGQNVIITARLLKPDHTPLTGQDVTAVAKIAADVNFSSSQPSTKPIQNSVNAKTAVGTIAARAKMLEIPDSPGMYITTLSGLPAGAIEVSLEGPKIAELLADVTEERQKALLLPIQKELSVEQQNTNTDKPRLNDIAKAGNGLMLDGMYASIATQYIPHPTTEQVQIEQLGFYGDPRSSYTRLTHIIFLALFCLLITAEWVIRKTVGLV